jgi:hypothetical protein
MINMKAPEPAPIELSGKLSHFRLIEIIQFLSLAKKTGVLELADGGGGRASLFFENGALVHAQSAEAEGRRAFDRIFRWVAGAFVFRSGVQVASKSIDVPVPLLLLESQQRILDLGRLSGRIPSDLTVFRLLSGQQDAPALSAAEWKVVALIDGRRTLAQICDLVGDEILAKKAVVELMERGFISAESSRSAFFALVPQAVTPDEFVGTRLFPNRVRTNLVLKSVDGRASIGELRSKLKIESGDMIEDIKTLYDSNWIRFSPRETEVYLNLRNDL